MCIIDFNIYTRAAGCLVKMAPRTYEDEMITFIGRIVRALFLIFILLFAMPTLVFLIKSYYINLIAKKTYVGIIKLPSFIEKSEDVLSSARTLFRASQIKAVILKIDGKGGNAGSCQAIHHDLTHLKNAYQKPLIAYCEEECSAGSYFIGTAADVIISNSATRINKLGIFDAQSETSDETISASNSIDYWSTISASRNKFSQSPSNFPHSLSGKNALDLGLVDHLGGPHEIEKTLRTKTVIEGRIEEVHGSFIEHFTLSMTNVVTYFIKAIRHAWNASNTK